MLPSLIDLVAPFDPTDYAQINGAQLYQLVSGLQNALSRGFVVTTSDVAGVPQVPDARATADGGPAADAGIKFQTYVWRRIQAASATAYLWSPNSALDAIYLHWIPITAAIPNNFVTGAMIAANTITDANISDVDWTKITDAPAAYPPNGAAGGSLTGAYPNPTVAAEAITNAMLGGSGVAAPCVDVTKNLVVGGVANQLIRVNGTATAHEYVTKKITELAEPAPADTLKLVQVNAGGTGYQKAAFQGDGSPGRVLQIVEVDDVTQTTGIVTTFVKDATPTTAGGTKLAGLDLKITPKSATSTLYIEVNLNLFIYSLAGGGGGLARRVACAALFSDLSANAIAVGLLGQDRVLGAAESAITSGSLVMRAKLAPGAKDVERTISVYVGLSSDAPVGAAHQLNYNISEGGTTFNTSPVSSIRVWEVI